MTIHALKSDGKLLKNLLSKVEEIKQLDEVFKQYLDNEIAAHCQAIKIDNHCLIVIVDSSSWGTQLRFFIPDLLMKLRTHSQFQTLKAICTKILPNYTPISRHKKRKINPLSIESAEAILEIAQTIKDDRLREILERMGARKK